MPSKTPYDTNALIKQTQDMLKQTAEQGTTAFAGSTYDTPASRTGAVPAITPASMAPIAPINVGTKPTPTNPLPTGVTVPPPISATATPTPTDTGADWMKELLGSVGAPPSVASGYEEGLKTATGDLQKEREAKRVAQKQAQDEFNAIQAQLQGVALEAQAIPIQIQQSAQEGGANVTKGGLAPIQTAALRNNALKAIPLQAQAYVAQAKLASAQGDTQLAQEALDSASAQFDKIYQMHLTDAQNMYEYKKDLRDKIYDYATKKEQQQLDALNRADDRKYAEKTKNIDWQRKLSEVAVKNNQSGVAMKISQLDPESPTFLDDLAKLEGQFVDPKSKFELENARLENILLGERIKTEQKQREQIGQPTQAEIKETEKEKKAIIETSKQAKAQIPAITNKINTLKSIATHKGLAGSVGAYGISRFTPLTPDKAERQDFKAKIHQLTGELTLDQLINAKARGATFGALSEGELGILAKSATTLNDWEVKDEKGQGTGVWEIDEKSFLAEINKIKELAERDRAMRTGEVFTTEEKNVLDQLFSQPSTYQQGNFDPSLFY